MVSSSRKEAPSAAMAAILIFPDFGDAYVHAFNVQAYEGFRARLCF
jgi:hypothetical protein